MTDCKSILDDLKRIKQEADFWEELLGIYGDTVLVNSKASIVEHLHCLLDHAKAYTGEGVSKDIWIHNTPDSLQ